MKSIKKFIERMDSTDSASSEKKLDGHHRRSSSCNSNNYSSKKKNSGRRLSPQSAPITPQPQFDDKSSVEILSILPESKPKQALKKTQSASPTIIKEAPVFPFPLHTQEEEEDTGEEVENEFEGLERKNVVGSSNEVDDKIRHSTGGFNFFAKGNKSGRNRKISLPWFRTNSVTTAQHAALSRQHTIDSPGFFTSYIGADDKVGNLEVTWVVADHTAAPGTSQLSVTKGQQVEIIEYTSAGETDFCLVRLNPQTDDGATQEGLVPISVLNPPPGSGSKGKKDKDATVDQGNRSKSDALTSGKRSGSGFKTRKWIPQLRKFSQGKGDNNKPSEDKQLSKKLSDKTITSIPIADLNISSTDPAEEEVEIPPPMKPIHQDSQSTDKSNNIGNNTEDIAEIEQIVRDKTKQHGSNFATSIDLASHSFDNDNIQERDAEAAKRKRMYNLDELIKTEQDYINDLGLLVNGYMKEIANEKSDIPLPDDLKENNNYRRVFANIGAIYEFHKDYFITALKLCQQQPSELGTWFQKYENRLHMYSVYCRNKPLSECYVQKHQNYFTQLKEKMNHRLELSDLLIKPVQRITKYELLLKEIIKNTDPNSEEIENLKEAYKIVKAIVKTINDMMELQKLENFPEIISNQGKLVLHGNLSCSEEPSDQPQKFREYKVFLCEQSIIFADIIPRKNPYSDDTFIYRAHFKMNKMKLEELSDYFLLKSTDPKKPINSFACKAEKEEVHRMWLDTIKRILTLMNELLLNLQNPLRNAVGGQSRDSL